MEKHGMVVCSGCGRMIRWVYVSYTGNMTNVFEVEEGECITHCARVRCPDCKTETQIDIR